MILTNLARVRGSWQGEAKSGGGHIAVLALGLGAGIIGIH